jgi:hypothetical protein
MRFIENDPLGFGGGDVNLYRFEGNEPTNATDPYGLAWKVLKQQLWDRGRWGPKKAQHYTATIEISLEYQEIPGNPGKYEFRLIYRVFPGKNKKGEVLRGTYDDVQEHRMVEMENTIRPPKGAKEPIQGQLSKQTMKGKLDGASRESKLAMSYSWVDLGQCAAPNKKTTLRGELYIYPHVYLQELKKGYDRISGGKVKRKPVEIKDTNTAAVHRIKWSITVKDGTKAPYGTIELTETGWGRNEEGENYQTAEIPKKWGSDPKFPITTPADVLKPTQPGAKPLFPLKD